MDVFNGYLVSPSWSAVVREMTLSQHPESSSAPTRMLRISTVTLSSLSCAVNGGVSRSYGSTDATRLLPCGLMIVVGPTRGAGFPVVTVCALLRGGIAADCTCTDFTISTTSLAVNMVLASVFRGTSEFCHSCSDIRMNCSTVDSGLGGLIFPLPPGV